MFYEILGVLLGIYGAMDFTALVCGAIFNHVVTGAVLTWCLLFLLRDMLFAIVLSMSLTQYMSQVYLYKLAQVVQYKWMYIAQNLVFTFAQSLPFVVLVVEYPRVDMRLSIAWMAVIINALIVLLLGAHVALERGQIAKRIEALQS